MPERSGYKVEGGWSAGTDAVNGNTITQTLVINEREWYKPEEYIASKFIEFEEGFESLGNDEFEAFIADETNTPAGNPGGSGGENNSYRYGFNGKENDDEVKGVGNQQDYGMRIYDTRVGRFLSVDPIAKKFPFYSTYQYAGNTPIWATDLDGLEPNPTTGNIQANFTFNNSSPNQISPAQMANIQASVIGELTRRTNNGHTYNNGTSDVSVSGTYTDVTGSNAPTTTANTRANGNWNFQINIFSGAGRSNADYQSGTINLFVGDPDNPDVSASFHEFGHLLGLSDRYAFFNHSSAARVGPGVAAGSRIITPAGAMMNGVQNSRWSGVQTIPVSIDPRVDFDYYGNETSNFMFDHRQNGVTQYQWSRIFTQSREPEWGGNNVYLSNTGVVGLRGIPVLGINSAGQVGFWQIDRANSIHFNVLGINGRIAGWYNDQTGQSNGLGSTLNLPQNQRFVPPNGTILNN